MSAKKWLMMLAGAVALALALCAGANILIDPFGVFGDPLFDWYSYNETNNPRTAKVAWLEENHGAYDSYIIGSSSASREAVSSPTVVLVVLTSAVMGARPLLAASSRAVSSAPIDVRNSRTSHSGWE